MKRIIIICEGQTEQVFCERILAPYMAAKGYHIQAPAIKHTRGGIVRWPVLKKQIEMHLLSEPGTFVTTFIDYYGLYTKHEFPGWTTGQVIVDKNLRMDHLERAMGLDIDPALQNRFKPYMQLHEFEGLLFNDIQIFRDQIPPADLIGLQELEQTFRDYNNPELINDHVNTAPSKRLVRIIRGYHKVVYGDILAESIGLERMRKKSPRFNEWLEGLESL